MSRVALATSPGSRRDSVSKSLHRSESPQGFQLLSAERSPTSAPQSHLSFHAASRLARCAALRARLETGSGIVASEGHRRAQLSELASAMPTVGPLARVRAFFVDGRRRLCQQEAVDFGQGTQRSGRRLCTRDVHRQALSHRDDPNRASKARPLRRCRCVLTNPKGRLNELKRVHHVCVEALLIWNRGVRVSRARTPSSH